MALLHRQGLSPATIKQVEAMGNLQEQILDRWMSGWKGKTLALEKAGRLVDEVKAQAETESGVLAQAREMSHLANHEKMALLGIDPQPPA